jgi:hypothetical protein
MVTITMVLVSSGLPVAVASDPSGVIVGMSHGRFQTFAAHLAKFNYRIIKAIVKIDLAWPRSLGGD